MHYSSPSSSNANDVSTFLWPPFLFLFYSPHSIRDWSNIQRRRFFQSSSFLLLWLHVAGNFCNWAGYCESQLFLGLPACLPNTIWLKKNRVDQRKRLWFLIVRWCEASWIGHIWMYNSWIISFVSWRQWVCLVIIWGRNVKLIVVNECVTNLQRLITRISLALWERRLLVAWCSNCSYLISSCRLFYMIAKWMRFFANKSKWN